MKISKTEENRRYYLKYKERVKIKNLETYYEKNLFKKDEERRKQYYTNNRERILKANNRRSKIRKENKMLNDWLLEFKDADNTVEN